MTVTLLSDVDVRAISLVKKGANRKRIFLYKCDDELFGDADLMEFPHRPIIKDGPGTDWSVFYAVVAEPEAHEDPGRTGVHEDRWASEDEIAKAAWQFMRNGALINRMHESLAPYGDVVENAVALDDLSVNGSTIKKGSWYIGVEPSEEARELIDKGELEGISIEGSAIRTEVEKLKLSSKARSQLPTSAFVFPAERRYPIHDRAHAANALARSSGKPEESRVRSAVCRRYPDMPACQQRGAVKKESVACPSCGFETWKSPVSELGEREEPRFCAGCGRRVPQPSPLWTWFEKHYVAKAHANEPPGRQAGPLRHLISFYMKKPHPFTACVRDNRKRFGPRTEAVCAGLKDVALQTHRWRGEKVAKDGEEDTAAMQEATFRACENIWASRALTDEDAILALQALSWHEGRKQGKVKTALKKIGKAVGLSDDDLRELDEPEDELIPEHEEDQVGLTKEESERLEKLEKGVSDLTATMTAAIEKLTPEKPPTAEELQKELGDLGGKLDGLREQIEKLAEGSSSVEDDPGTNGTKRTDVKKDRPLAGLLLE